MIYGSFLGCIVMPVKTGIQGWIPSFEGMTK